MFVIGNVCLAVATILDKVLWIYGLLVFIAVLIQWVNPDPFNPLVRFLRSVTDPVFEHIRRRLPFIVIGSIDLSPMVVFLLIWFTRMVLVQSLFDFSMRLR